MSWTTHPQDRRQLVRFASVVVSWISFAALTGLVTLFATSTLHGTPIHSTALAAAIFDLLAVASFLVFALVYGATGGAVSRTSARSTAITVAIMLLTGFGLLLSIIVLGWMHPRLARLEVLHHSRDVSTMFGAGLAIWGVTLLLGIACILLYLNDTPSSEGRVCLYTTEYTTKEGVPCIVAKPLMPGSPYSDCASPSSPAFLVSPLSTFRTSMVSLLRPKSSKSSLAGPHKEPYTKDKASITLEIPSKPARKEDGFELWEVNTPQSSHNTLSFRESHNSKVLGMLPSPSLDGHFQTNDSTSPEETPLPPSPPRKLPKMPSRLQLDAKQMTLDPLIPPSHFINSRPSSPTVGATSITSPTKSFMSTHTAKRSSSRASIGLDQLHIHPLFRTIESPVPSPLGTSHSTVFANVPWGAAGEPARSRSVSGISGQVGLVAHKEPLAAWKSKSQTDLSSSYKAREPIPPLP